MLKELTYKEKQVKLFDLELWFSWYDLQVKKHERDLRAGKESDISKLDAKAKVIATEINKLREDLGMPANEEPII